MAPSMNLEDLIVALYDVKGLKFGSFTMRTGEVTPVYIDMRVIWSYPNIVVAVSEHIWELAKRLNLEYNVISGLPYQGIPLATYLSTTHNIPMILKRQKTKWYGTKQTMEGHYTEGDKALLIDDVLMTGATLVDQIPVYRQEKLQVDSVVLFFDREQGGGTRVKVTTGADVYSVITLSKAFEYLIKHGRVTQVTADLAMEYIRANQFDLLREVTVEEPE